MEGQADGPYPQCRASGCRPWDGPLKASRLVFRVALAGLSGLDKAVIRSDCYRRPSLQNGVKDEYSQRHCQGRRQHAP
jgi:hypothetical protein